MLYCTTVRGSKIMVRFQGPRDLIFNHEIRNQVLLDTCQIHCMFFYPRDVLLAGAGEAPGQCPASKGGQWNTSLESHGSDNHPERERAYCSTKCVETLHYFR